MNLFLQYFGGRGPRGQGSKAEDKGRGLRVEEREHPSELGITTLLHYPIQG